MVFGLFQKKEIRKLKNQFLELENNNSLSFQKFKSDINTISKWIAHFKETKTSHHSELQKLKREIEELRYIIHDHFSNHPSLDLSTDEFPLSIEKNNLNNLKADPLKHLTSQQKQLLYVICSLYNEKGDALSLKEIANELYPNKEYNMVRTTLLEYTSLLEELDLVSKQRKGKKSTIHLTKKGKTVAKNISSKPKIKVRKIYK